MRSVQTRASNTVVCILYAGVLVMLLLPTMAAALPAFTSEQALVNRSHPLVPNTYVPPDLTVPKTALLTGPNDSEMSLRPAAATALTNMFAAASKDDIVLLLSSGYRSFIDQTLLYDDIIAGNSTLTDMVAPPGTSEHQTGLAADIILQSGFCAAQACFGMTRASEWLARNAHTYGFIMRYPLYKKHSTGYEYEPWHYRYVGVPLAAKLYTSRQVLEEYYLDQPSLGV
jgi:D-alanyl-D-alanine carboxypeptidase